jgi:hypothetical protein
MKSELFKPTTEPEPKRPAFPFLAEYVWYELGPGEKVVLQNSIP